MKIGKSAETTTAHVTNVVNEILNDAQLLHAVADALIPYLFSIANMRDLVDAIESVNDTARKTAPGRLYAATVVALTLNGSSQATRAQVVLNGASTAVVAYVPPHIRAGIATSQDVRVEAVNGNMSDLKIDAIRNIP